MLVYLSVRYLAGFLALLYYARYVQNACDYLDVIHTVCDTTCD